jgi:voltage-gated potassium channel
MLRTRITITLSLLMVTLVGGALGYRLIEGWNWLDSVYMTVITLTTVGFGEINPLSPTGRLFTVFVILGGAGVVAYALSSAGEIIGSGELRREIRLRRRIRLKNHTIICGFGRVGRSVAAELKREGVPFVVIDIDEETTETCRRLGYDTVQGNAANNEILRRAGIETARSVVTSAKSDAENVFIILTVRELREDILIISRLNYEESEPKLLKAGANRVISPYNLAGHRIVSTISRPAVTDFLDTVLRSEDVELWLEEVDIQPGSPLANKTLSDARIRNEIGVTILAVDLPGQKVITHPKASTPLFPGARLIVLGTREQLKQLSQLASHV